VARFDCSWIPPTPERSYRRVSSPSAFIMRPAQLLATAFALASVSAAFQPVENDIEFKGIGDFILTGRQQDQSPSKLTTTMAQETEVANKS
jgi:hypothetical protein